MTRASISISPPNDEWIQSQINSEEFSSRSEVVNDLIRKARKQQDELRYIRAKLIASEKAVEQYGWVDKSRDKILAELKDELRRDGKL
ncbi:MAG: hypothetical protein L3J22_03785 [Xanthomonadales bacterium]|nr:hypothetical protein [Xanthomonadales bacterium]